MREPKIVARLSDGKALVSVGTFNKRILALEVEDLINLPGCETWEYVSDPHPQNVFASTPAAQSFELGGRD
ncbi:hypothetical protein ACOY5P_03455 [Enterobacter asburiae]|uniref:hypothetical protein n=1 Tax=Enterobacter asburiae TaxID=61645 RepID=UPI002A5891C6|nr:hypothetical protein [Enterobacter hormaechei]